MNKDQVKGGWKSTLGRMQANFGRNTGSQSQEAKGLGKQTSGTVQKTLGAFRNIFKNKH